MGFGCRAEKSSWLMPSGQFPGLYRAEEVGMTYFLDDISMKFSVGKFGEPANVFAGNGLAYSLGKISCNVFTIDRLNIEYFGIIIRLQFFRNRTQFSEK